MKVSPRQYLHALKTAHRQASNKTLQHDLKELHDHIEKNRICWASLKDEAGKQQLEQASKDLEEARELLKAVDRDILGPRWFERRDAFLHKTAPGVAQRGEGDG
ncbi:MAG: hypothetical protein AAGI72_06605 [Pseudomonadota bacterium]